MFTTRHVRSVIGFSGLNWIKICASLKKEYKDRDIAQQISSCAYLEALKDKPRTGNAEVLQFCLDYSEISNELLGKKQLDNYTQLRWFLQGLPSFIQSKLINQYDIDLDGDTPLDFGDILKKAYTLIETRKKMAERGTTDTRHDLISDLVNCHAKNDQLDKPFSGLFKLSNSVFQVQIVSTAPFISATPSQNDKKIDHLTDMMQSLAFSVCTLQDNRVVLLLFLRLEQNQPIRLLDLKYVLIIDEMVLIDTGLKEQPNVFIIGKQVIILSGAVRFFKMISTQIKYTQGMKVKCT